jgi:hypothetical protein
VSCRAQSVVSEDFELQSLSRLAAISTTATASGDQIIDCRRERNWAMFASNQMAEPLASLGSRYARVTFDFADGARFIFEPKQRWRFWRRSLGKLA